MERERHSRHSDCIIASGFSIRTWPLTSTFSARGNKTTSVNLASVLDWGLRGSFNKYKLQLSCRLVCQFCMNSLLLFLYDSLIFSTDQSLSSAAMEHLAWDHSSNH